MRESLASSKNRVGIFAGAFDPIHDGHLEVALSAVSALELDMVYFMVESSPWTDKQPIAVEYRREMVKIVTQKIANLSQLIIDDQRFDITITLPKIEREFPHDELYFIFGADVFLRMNINQWPSLKNLFQHYIVVFERGDISELKITEHAKKLGIVVAILPSKYLHHCSTDVRVKPHE